MSAVLTYLGTFLLSLFVALLAALQLADFFSATEEFIVVLMALPVFTLISLMVFVVVGWTARAVGAFHWVALALALIVLVSIGLLQVAASRPGTATVIGPDNVSIVLELVVPALIAILIQWGLVRRHWLRRRGENDLSRWPWIATAVAGLAILNPLGLHAVGQTLAGSGAGGDTVRTATMGAAAAIIVLTLGEYYIRDRMLRRRHPQNGPAMGVGGVH